MFSDFGPKPNIGNGGLHGLLDSAALKKEPETQKAWQTMLGIYLAT